MSGKRFVSTGLNMVDHVIYADEGDAYIMGGIPIYGFAGMCTWLKPKDIAFGARCGRDFFKHYEPWFSNNLVDESDLIYVSDVTPYNNLYYNNNFDVTDCTFFTGNFKDSNHWRPHAEDVTHWIGDETRGFYTCCAPDDEMWKGVFSLKEKHDFSIMWEPNYVNTFPEKKESTISLCQRIEMASFNVPEGCRLFGIESEEKLIEFLKNLGPTMTLLRCGARGLYVIMNGDVVFVPSACVPDGHQVVDTTGCGNASTAGACVAFCNGDNALMIGVKANISSSYVLCQKGPWPTYNDELRAEAQNRAKKIYSDLSATEKN